MIKKNALSTVVWFGLMLLLHACVATTPASTSSRNCMVLSGFNSQINGEWVQQGTNDNKPYFERGNLKLFYNSQYGNIHIDSSLGPNAQWFCHGSSFTQCTAGKWYSQDSNGNWNSNADSDARVIAAECSPSVSPTTAAITARPTRSPSSRVYSANQGASSLTYSSYSYSAGMAIAYDEKNKTALFIGGFSDFFFERVGKL